MKKQRPEFVLFAGEDGKVYAGKVKFYEDWAERHARGEAAKIFDIEFREDNKPEALQEEDISDVIAFGEEEFKDKMGVSWEIYNGY